MDNLIQINNAIQMGLQVKAIVPGDRTVLIANTVFSNHDVDQNGKFIGQKYKRFLFFKYITPTYNLYKNVILDGFNIGFYIGERFYTSHFIEISLQNMLKSNIFTKDITKLYDLYIQAKNNVKEQNKILVQLARDQKFYFK